MNRLTEKDSQGNWGLKGIRWEQLHEGQVITGELREKLYGALWKLMEYEDTDLTPEEVEEVNDFSKSQVGQLLNELSKERRKHKWIPVEERLPETKEYRTTLLATVSCEYWKNNKTLVVEWENTTVRGKDVSRWIWNDRLFPEDWVIIAWQPLPEPYRPDPKQDKPSGWQEQMMGAFLGDSRL